MSKWLQLLIPVLDKFIETVSGNPDLEWWNKVCHRYAGGSGPSYLTGWVTVFNVFSNEGDWLADKKSDDWRRIRDVPWPLVNTNDISYGYTSFTITVDNYGDIFKAHMYTGCMGAEIINNDTIVPRLDWGVVREISIEEKQALDEVKRQEKIKKEEERKERERLIFIEKNKAKIEAGKKILAESTAINYNFTNQFSSF